MTVVLIKRNQHEQTAASPFTVGHFVPDIRHLKPTANIHLMPRSSVSVCWRFVSPPASAACWANQTDQTSLSKRSFCVFVCRPSRVTQSSVWFVIRDNERRPNLPGVPAPATTGWHHSSETDVWSHTHTHTVNNSMLAVFLCPALCEENHCWIRFDQEHVVQCVHGCVNCLLWSN